MNMEELIVAVQEWSKNKGLDKVDSRGQFLKVVEEAAEIAEALEKKKWVIGYSRDGVQEEIQDAIGDTYVTLIILAQQQNIDFVELWENSRSISVILSTSDILARVNSILIELGKISGHLARGKEKDKIRSGIRYATFRLIPTLRSLAQENGLKSSECLEMAYNVIAKRKGKMIDGVFVKEEDLKDGQ